MNKQEKFIAVLLGLCLAGWLWYSVSEQKKAAEAARAATASHQVAPVAAPQTNAPAAVSEAQAKVNDAPEANVPGAPDKVSYVRPEKLVTLCNAQEVVVLSTHGAAVKSVTLLEYARDCG